MTSSAEWQRYPLSLATIEAHANLGQLETFYMTIGWCSRRGVEDRGNRGAEIEQRRSQDS
jgi:hypothetical protein